MNKPKYQKGYRPIGIDHFSDDGEAYYLTEADCLESLGLPKKYSEKVAIIMNLFVNLGLLGLIIMKMNLNVMNNPSYQIGDRLPGTNIYVRGVMTTSQGKHIYFWQMGDNSLVVSEEQIEGMLDILLVQSA